ncbi:MAG TPA: hypothetical protein VHX64_19190 [Caulobacteraceae bacterium]|nr:hypothetical protein [Caulobacteraceae bacterium]
MAAFTGQALAAGTSDSTTVQGLVIQGRLSTEVRGLTVMPTHLCLLPRKPPDPDVPPPKLVSSFPADGAVVKPGLVVFRLTFDLPMACMGVLEPVLLVDNPCPAPLIDPVISKDRRTFMTVCLVQPSDRYGVWLDFNSTKRWTSLAGHRLSPRQILFSTSSGAKVRTLRDAIAEDPFLGTMVGQAPAAAAASPPMADDVAKAPPAAAKRP